MSADPLIFIPVESKKREFDGKVLLASALLRRGFRVMLGTKVGVHRELIYTRNAIYLAKSASNENLDLYRHLKSLGHKLVVLDVEGGALTKEIRNDLLRSYQPEASEFFDYFYVFGDKIREAVINELDYIDPDKVITTGEPRFDLLRPEYDNFYAGEIKRIGDLYGRFILINTSFGFSNSILGEEGIQRLLENTTDIPDEQRPLYILKFETGKQLLLDFADLAKHLASEYPELNIVIRPHPDEDPSTYMKLTEGVRNIHVKCEGNVHPWIRASVGVIHHDCTTGLEAVMSAKPAISYLPSIEESITAWLPVYLSIECKTCQEVSAEVGKILLRPDEPWYPGEEKAEVFTSYFRNYAEPANTLLASSLNDAYQGICTTFKPSPSLLKERLHSRIRIHRYNRNKQPGKRERFMSVSVDEVKEKLSLAGIESVGSEISIRVLGGNAILLAKSRKP